MLETESPKALRSEPEPVTPEKEFGVQDRLRCMRSFLSVVSERSTPTFQYHRS